MFEILFDNIKVSVYIVGPVFTDEVCMMWFEIINKELIRIQPIQKSYAFVLAAAGRSYFLLFGSQCNVRSSMYRYS